MTDTKTQVKTIVSDVTLTESDGIIVVNSPSPITITLPLLTYDENQDTPTYMSTIRYLITIIDDNNHTLATQSGNHFENQLIIQITINRTNPIRVFSYMNNWLMN